MANNYIILCSSFLVVLFSCSFVSICYGVPSHTFPRKQGGKLECVANPLLAASDYQAFLDDACSTWDCTSIQQGGICFWPNTLIAHTSYVLDLVYCGTGTCDPKIGILTTFDHSFEECNYP